MFIERQQRQYRKSGIFEWEVNEWEVNEWEGFGLLVDGEVQVDCLNG